MLSTCFSSIVLLASIGTVAFGQSPAVPISKETCDALKDIAANANTLIATCTVQDGCGAMECTNSAAGSSLLTLKPCADPPFFVAKFFDLSDTLIHEENLTAQHDIAFGSAVLMFTVTQIEAGISLQVNAAIGVTLPFIAYSEIPIDTSLCDAPAISPSFPTSSNPSFATSTPSFATSTLSSVTSSPMHSFATSTHSFATSTLSSVTSSPMHSFATSTPSSATSTPSSSSIAAGTPMPSESATGSGCIEAVQFCLLMFLVLCSCWVMLW